MKTKHKEMHSSAEMPKSLRVKPNRRPGFRSRNYFYRVFDHIGAQFAAINQGLKDSGPTRAWQLK